MEQPNLAELALKAKAGDEAAFSALYEQCAQRVYFLALQMLKNREDAADCMQEVFIQAFRHIGRLEHPEGVLTWLYRITANRCKNRLRQRGELSWEELDMPEPQEESEAFLPQSCLDSMEKRRLLQEIVDKLPADQRACVVLYYYSELPIPEIAQLLECPEGTVKSRLNYARQKIKAGILAVEERDGIRLHVFVPVPLIFAVLQQIPQEALPSAEILRSCWQAIAAGAGLVAGGAGTTAAQAAAGAAKMSFWTAAKVKIAAVVTAGAVVVTGAGTFLALQPKPLHFEDTVVEAQLRLYLDKPEGTITEKDVAGIERISIAENHWFINDRNVSYFGNADDYYGRYDQHGRYSVSDPDGIFYVEGTEAQEIVDRGPDLGAVDTYRDLAQLPALRTLSLSKEPVRDLSFLGELPALERLTLAAIPEESLATLPACPQLKFLSLVGLSASTPISLRGSPLVTLHFFAYTSGGAMAPPDLTGQDRLRDYNYNLFLYEGGDEQYPAIELGDLREAPHLTYLRTPGSGDHSGVIKLLPELTELRGLELGTLTESDLDLLAELPKLEVLSGTIGEDAVEAALRLDNAPTMGCLMLNTVVDGFLQTPRCSNEYSDFSKIREEIDQQIFDEVGLTP